MKTTRITTILIVCLFMQASGAYSKDVPAGVYISVEGNLTFVLSIPKAAENAQIFLSIYRSTPEGLKRISTTTADLRSAESEIFTVTTTPRPTRFMIETRQIGNKAAVTTIIHVEGEEGREIHHPFTFIYNAVDDIPVC